MQRSQPTIRLARADDLDDIARFADQVVHDTYDRLVGREYAEVLRRDWWSATLTDAVERSLVHVAVDDQIVGLVERGTIDDDPVIWKLYVSAERRNAGVGRRLLATAIASIDRRSRRVLLEHIAANVDAARFYTREGFEVVRVEGASDPAQQVVWRALDLDSRERNTR